ncbi:MAG: cytochrome b/b6 domain-containing protein [Novosphingobium sp.]
MTEAIDQPAAATVRLWDAPVRVVHWSFVLLLPALWWSAEVKTDIGLHKTLGYILLALLTFRILWGFVGSSTARFGHFLRGPGGVIEYLRSKQAEPIVGHNPLGGWSVLLVLALLLVQLVAGLFAQDVDGIESGPLSYLVSYDTADAARGIHHLVFNLILGMVGLHLAAILFYRFVRRHDLIAPMVTGRRRFAAEVTAPVFVPVWRVVVCAAIGLGLAWWVSLGSPLPWAEG